MRQYVNWVTRKLSAKLEDCERAVAAFIAAVEEWPEAVTMSAVFQQRAKLSLAKVAMLDAMQALPFDLPEELRHELRLKFDA